MIALTKNLIKNARPLTNTLTHRFYFSENNKT